jgi:hypothetical protein
MDGFTNAMKRLLIIFVLCLATSRCFATIALVQQTSNASGSATSPSLGFTATTSAVAFPSATSAGNLVVGITWGRGTSTSGTISSLNSISINSIGQSITFTFGQASGSWTDAGGTANGEATIFFCANCPAIANTTTFTFTGNMSGSGNCGGTCGLGLTVEFALYEFSGITTTSPKDQSASSSGTSSVPMNSSNFIANQADLGVAAYSGQPGSNVSVGACCILGTNASAATVGQIQYVTTLSTGTTSASFSGGTVPLWVGTEITFKMAAAPAAGVSRHRGSVF